MRVGITYNVKRSSSLSEESDDVPLDDQAEWDDPETVQTIIATFSKYHDVIPIEADLEAYEKLRRLRPDIVFNIAEGRFGASREAQIPAILEMLRIPYTGSDPLTLGICLDKSRAKEILAYHRIPTAKFGVIQSWPLNGQLKHVDYPMFVKPLFEGSSKGIWNDALVHNFAELKVGVEKIWKTYSQPALVEEYLPGREFTVAMLGNGPTLRLLPIVEISFDTLPAEVNKFYSYEAKWIWDQPDQPLEIFHCPAQLDPGLQARIETICKKAFTRLNCRDWCRVDVRLDDMGEPCIVELNPLPGIIPDPAANSCFPKAARAAGMSYDDLLLTVLDEACRRLRIAPTQKVFAPKTSEEVLA
ncbi:MAG: D-alanine--D-alanine ligase [candidate division KSB1 bacterium]|nr:D-alanine--D-alanine ligase [candidate division KSB1 bacterium]MDZ7305409.1 D-alanine--D-alanine ligase [candidate division KSB1 bacterium]MDZ7314481.1 D-alanine--D-alanine ligase [candidate division KSB1 bacterium]